MGYTYSYLREDVVGFQEGVEVSSFGQLLVQLVQEHLCRLGRVPGDHGPLHTILDQQVQQVQDPRLQLKLSGGCSKNTV